MTAFHNLLMGSANISSVQFVGMKVASAVTNGAAQASLTLSGLSGGLNTSPLPGDMVVVTAVLNDSTDIAITIGSGYTLIGTELKAPGGGPNMRTSYKVMGGSPDSSVVVTFGALTSAPCIIEARVYRGFDPSTPIDVTATTATGGPSSTTANPPSITPVTPGSLIVAVGAGYTATTPTNFSSSDLSSFQQLTYTVGTTTMIGSGHTAWSGSGANDPAAFGGGWASSGFWAAITYAIRST